MISKANVIRNHGFKSSSQPPLVKNEIFSTIYEEGLCCLAQKAHALRWFLDMVSETSILKYHDSNLNHISLKVEDSAEDTKGVSVV